jgi:hypothetical protein
MLISTSLWSLHASSISILIIMKNVIQRCLLQLLYEICFTLAFQSWSIWKRYAKMLVSILCSVCSKPAFQIWSSCKMLCKDSHFNSSMKSVLNQHFNLDRQGKHYRKMLISTSLWYLLSINISILIIMQNVIERSSFQLLYEVCSKPAFQSCL